MNKYLLKIKSVFIKAKGRYGLAVFIIFPVIVSYKLIRKTILIAGDAYEYCKYIFWENNKYDIEYLKKITGIYNEDQLWEVVNERRELLMGCIDEDAINVYNRFFENAKIEKIDHAEMICAHIFDLLGSGPKIVNLERNNSELIDWQLDSKSGYRWNSRTFRKWIKHGNIEGVDIIVPWEHSRFQERISLAQAYKLTKNHKYVTEFQSQIIDWIDNNRFGFGVNWVCTMDIAIRAANWIIIKELFETDFNFPKLFLIKLYGSLYEHGRYVKNHLQSFNTVTTNHYVSGLVGLLCIAVYCPFFKKSEEWRNFAVMELEKEIERQVYSDGCDYEASTSYHLLVLEIFFYALLIGERAGISFSDSYKSKVKKMFEASLYIMKSSGHVPQIGDNDNGRLFKLSKKSVNNHKYLLSLAAVYFNDGNFKLKQHELDEDAFWIFGKSTKQIWDDLPYREDAISSKSFKGAGWYIIRHMNDYCFISCGPNGQGGRGGHAHNDKLSFELVIDGHDIIVDPGTYAYTSYPKERNKFRSTEYHNTIKLNGYEQNEIPAQAPHFLPDTVDIVNAEITETEDVIMFQGEIKYADIRHKRVIVRNKKSNSWHIVDNMYCPSKVHGTLIFHLAPNLVCEGNRLETKEGRRDVAFIEVEGYELIKNKYDYSPEYGVKVEAESLIADVTCTERCQVSTIIKSAYSRTVNRR